jgi:hypothetical protein
VVLVKSVKKRAATPFGVGLVILLVPRGEQNNSYNVSLARTARRLATLG